MRQIRLLLFLCLLLIGAAGYGQVRSTEATVRGTVSDEEGNPVSGVTIVVKNAQNRQTVSDESGKFSILVSRGNVLVFSHVSFATKELRIANTTEAINLMLEKNRGSMDEVVVIGYGTVKRKDLTGSVASVKAKDIVKSTDASLNSALQGRAAGVSVVSTEGKPGAAVSIYVRAGSSITASNDPLYVIDGFPTLGGSNLNLNVNDIESVEILKDASATAIYGSRGANGVIIITTKRGKTGRFSVGYDGYYSFQQLGRKIPVMNSLQYAEFQHYISTNPRNSSVGDSMWYNWPTYKDTATTIWQDKLYRIAGMHNHNISFTGGTDDVKIAGSVSATNQDGIAVGTNFERYTARLNSTANINKIISNNTTISVGYLQMKGGSLTGEGGLAYSAVRGSPYKPVGINLNDYLILHGIPPGGNDGMDPLVELLEPDVKELEYFAGINTEFSIRLAEGLTFKVMGGVDFSHSQNNSFYGSNTLNGSLTNGEASKNSAVWLGLINENTLNYSKSWGGSSIDVVGGFSLQNSTSTYTNTLTREFAIEALGYNNMAMGSRLRAPASGKTVSGIESYFGRVQYNFHDRYIITGTMRADGSSKFPIHKWGYFPSGGIAWKMNDENFMKSLKSVSTLKLRLTYGLTGNESVAPYSTYTSYGPPYIPPVSGNQVVVGVLPTQLGSPELKWETTIQTNFGLDFGLFEDRIVFTGDIYHKKSKDLLLDAPLSTYSGFESVTRNIGDIEVKGAELALNTVNVSGRKFRWTTNFNIAFNKTKVLSLNEGQDYFYTGSMSRFDNIYIVKVGESLGSMYGFVYDGLVNTQDELSTIPIHDAFPVTVGTRMYKDIDGWDRDGKPDGVIDENDRRIIGNGNPKFFGGFSNEFSYSGFELSFLFTYSYGNDVLNAYKSLFPAATPFHGGPVTMFNRWTPENPQINNQRWDASYNGEYNYVTSYMVEDGSYLRLKNIQLAYNLNSNWLKKARIQKVRIYATAQNLLTFTRYTGYDPEVSYFNSLITPGADLGGYPRSKIYTLGLNLSF
ncbi:MAG: TonB-dependent receptor [Bacteroidetes bacterium]|nr:TonB-dependent receptor [Bacteroidota bacterium]